MSRVEGGEEGETQKSKSFIEPPDLNQEEDQMTLLHLERETTEATMVHVNPVETTKQLFPSDAPTAVPPTPVKPVFDDPIKMLVQPQDLNQGNLCEM